MRPALVALAAFLVMEPVTYAVHRWVMHGAGIVLHRSHHRARAVGRWEANDAYPVAFAALVVMAMAVGLNVAGFEVLVWAGIGVTAYGAVYGLVHDVYIHRRLPLFGDKDLPVMRSLEDAHRIHHLYDGEPYGMLLPIVPRALRERARATDRAPHRR